MSEDKEVEAAIAALANALVEQNKWPAELARAAAETFAAMQCKCPDELKRYAQMSQREKRDLWSYYATGFNQGWSYAKLDTN